MAFFFFFFFAFPSRQRCATVRVTGVIFVAGIGTAYGPESAAVKEIFMVAAKIYCSLSLVTESEYYIVPGQTPSRPFTLAYSLTLPKDRRDRQEPNSLETRKKGNALSRRVSSVLGNDIRLKRSTGSISGLLIGGRAE